MEVAACEKLVDDRSLHTSLKSLESFQQINEIKAQILNSYHSAPLPLSLFREINLMNVF